MMLGVWFKPLERWNIHVFGLYFKTIQQRFPRFETGPFTQSGMSSNVALMFPFSRALYFDSSNTRLVQLQQDMFFANWRKITATDAYPRFEAQKSFFISEWRQLLALLEAAGTSKPTPINAVISYINHVEVPAGKRLGDVINDTFGIWRPLPELPEQGALRSGSLSATYDLPGKAQLTLQITPAIRSTDSVNTVQFQFTVLQPLSQQSEETLASVFDTSREWINKSFLSFTSENARQEWGQEK